MSKQTGMPFFQKAIIILGGLIAPFFILYSFIVPPVVPVVDKGIAERIKPLAVVEVAPQRAAGEEQSGEQVVKTACAACHASGALGAPKIGDLASWQPRIGQGYDTLVQHAIEGIRTMPARGGNPDLTDNEVAKAVVHMANQSGAQFPEPKAAE